MIFILRFHLKITFAFTFKWAIYRYGTKTLGQTNTNLALVHDLFENDALVFETKGLNAYAIRSENLATV